MASHHGGLFARISTSGMLCALPDQSVQPPAGLPVLEFGNPFNQSQVTEGYNMTA